jgi:N-acetylglucosaminyl-diphospho-decaprenol L-rhamnosyltransferase
MASESSRAEGPRWAAVVVNYEAGSSLTRCVASVLADGSAGGPPEVVVVDNGSSDDSVDRLRAAFPDVPIIDPDANLGYGRAANLGIAATSAPVVAVLNPDAEVAAGTAAAVLDRFDTDDQVAAVGPQLLNPDRTPYPSARSAPSLRDAVGHALLGTVSPGNRFTESYRQLDADPDLPRNVEWISGAAVWLRRDALDRVGGWDERFFLFFEDVDLCRRLGADGWLIVYEPGGHVTHTVGGSRARRPLRSIFEHHRAAFQYAAKWWHGPRRLLLPLAAVFLAGRGAVVAGGSAVQARRGTDATTE